jgi:hypothetical protein
MAQLFTISFTYHVKPHFLQVDLCAEIEMIDNVTCMVHNIRRVNINESSLLPILTLRNAKGFWIHSDTGKESNISKTIGEAIDSYLKDIQKSRNEMKDNI